jgi:hypothetical protein
LVFFVYHKNSSFDNVDNLFLLKNRNSPKNFIKICKKNLLNLIGQKNFFKMYKKN